MDAAAIVAIIVTVLILVALAVWGARRRAATQLEQARYQAASTRDLARVAEVEAEREAAEADEAAARAERQRLAAEQARLTAEQKRQDAADLHREADEIDPDVELDLEAEADVDAAAAEPSAIDLRDEETVEPDRAAFDQEHLPQRER